MNQMIDFLERTDLKLSLISSQLPILITLRGNMRNLREEVRKIRSLIDTKDEFLMEHFLGYTCSYKFDFYKLYEERYMSCRLSFIEFLYEIRYNHKFNPYFSKIIRCNKIEDPFIK